MSLTEFFVSTYHSDTLLKLVKLCNGSSKLTRKEQRADFLAQTLTDPVSLARLWEQMDDLSRKAVTEAYHNEGVFVADAFVARYEALPERQRKQVWSYYSEPILIDLFFYRGRILPELMPLLSALVPPLEPYKLVGVATEPTTIAVRGTTLELIRAETEEAGWHDLLLFLQLIDQGTVKLSSTSFRPTPSSTSVLLGALLEGDFLQVPPGDKVNVEQTIRAYGLTAFAAGAKLISTAGKGQLTAEGRDLLENQDPELLLDTFETWTSDSNIEELQRIVALKGLRSRHTHLTHPGRRRERIVEALSWCPTDVWIPIQEFYRALKIWYFDFQLEEDGGGRLYMGYRQASNRYSEPWASASNSWLLTNGLYINVILWEILGSIGALDLLYLLPEEAILTASPYYDIDTPYYSLYDGLCYFRINPLGAYLFGQAREYSPARPADETLFAVTADRQIRVLRPERITPVIAARIEQIAEPQGEQRWTVDRQKLLLALEQGTEMANLCDFLRRHNQGPLPAEIESWLAEIEANSVAFSVKSDALLIQARRQELVTEILADAELSKFAKQVEARLLVIPASRATRFRNRLRELGYGLQ